MERTSVQVRIEGNSTPTIKRAADQMGVSLRGRMYRKRNGKGYFAYGWKEVRPAVRHPSF